MTATPNHVLLGAYIGIPGQANATTQYNSFVNAMGQVPTLADVYVDSTLPESQWVSQAQWGAGVMASASWSAAMIPVVGIPMASSGENGDQSFRNIANGSEDSIFNGIFQAYAAVSKSFYIRPGWEMNGNWYAWSVTSSNAADFVAAFQHIAALAHSFTGADIKVVWNPNYSGYVDYNSMYPGNQAVDVIGMDTYGVDAGGTADLSPFDTSTNPTDFTVKDALAMAVANGKPFALPEAGGGANDTTFPANLASVIAGSGAQVAFVNIWDDPSGGNSSLYWSDTSSTAAAWRQAFATIAAGSPGAPSPTPTPTPTAPPSPNGTTIKSAASSPIIDQTGNAWTLVQSASKGLQIAVNGTVDAVTSNVVLLETLNGNIVQENSSGNWYSEPGRSGPWTQITAPTPTPTPAPTPTPTPSPNGTTIKSASSSPIIDQTGNAWTLVQSASKGLQIAVNGTVDAVTSNVILLETLNGNIVQENSSGNWYSEPGRSGPWTQITAPTPTPTPAPTPTPTPSPNGTTITSASSSPIIDQTGNAWTLVQSASKGLQIAVNGTVDAVTSNVVLLETLNGNIVQENSSSNWYSEPGRSGPWTQITAPAPTPSANDTAVMAGSNTAIVDASGNKWTITTGGQIAVNGTVDPVTANVVELIYTKGAIWQENASSLWWSKTTPGAAWGPTAGTATPPVSIAVINNATSSVTTIDATKVQNATAYAATFHLTAPGVAQVTLGGTSDTMHFLGLVSVNLTAGTAAATVTSDGGTNTFTAGQATLSVAGGTGVDTYVYHAGNARLTVQDFSVANGDSLKVDAALQGSLKVASDGQGGTLLTFGVASAGIDLKGIGTLPTANIHWS